MCFLGQNSWYMMLFYFIEGSFLLYQYASPAALLWVQQLDSPTVLYIGNMNMMFVEFLNILFSFKFTEETLKYIMYKLQSESNNILVYLIFIFFPKVMQKCQTIVLSDYRTVRLSIHTRCRLDGLPNRQQGGFVWCKRQKSNLSCICLVNKLFLLKVSGV